MASFHSKTFKVHDDYMTPDSAWNAIKEYIPKDKVIWEAFYGDGNSGKILTKLGFNVIHENIDFFKENKGDIIVSNPPFSKAKEILTRLKELNKPFILIMPCSKIHTQYIRQFFMNDQLQIIIPRKRIQFIKIVNGKKSEDKSCCNFDCFYFCYKLNLNKDIIWLD